MEDKVSYSKASVRTQHPLLAIRVPPETMQWLKQEAKEQDRSVSSLVRILIKRAREASQQSVRKDTTGLEEEERHGRQG